jgi:predicted RNA methylase
MDGPKPRKEKPRMTTQPAFTATYSPDDNKIRLYTSTRLESHIYDRVRAAGFRWAPKQELFFAPAWTPHAEDLAIELAGELEDEDSTLMDRAEVRAERFEGYYERRGAEANQAEKAVSRVSERFAGGQPILVGHHSERAARRDQERIHSGMRKALKLWDTSRYWSARAAAAINHARYVERPDVRHRRIRKIEAEQRRWLREREKAALWLKLWETLDNPNIFKRADGAPTTKLERARFLAGRCNLTVVREGDKHWTAWDVLREESERWQGCPIMTPEECQEAARQAYPKQIAHCDRWINHLENRLTYERGMLEDQGGYREPPKPPSKASLPILNYSGSVSYRSPYNPGEVVTGDAVPLTKAEWAAINIDYKGTRVSSCGTHRVRTTIMAPGRRHQLVTVFLSDSKTHPRPTQDQVAAKLAEEEEVKEAAAEDRLRRLAERARHTIPNPPDPQEERFEALAEQLKAGVKIAVAPQLFPTPPELASRMVELADVQPGQRVLEPESGTGNLVMAVFDVAPVDVVAVEINPSLAAGLRQWIPAGNDSRLDVRCADFLECDEATLGTFDRIVMNPPFAKAADIRHIEHAMKLLRRGGLLVATCANGPRQRDALKPRAAYWEDLPPNTFKEAGTSVNTALLMLKG